MSRLLHFSLRIFHRPGIAGHRSSARDQLAHSDVASERRKRANGSVYELH